MKIFKIVKDSDKNLRKKCLEVSLPLDEETKNTLLEMIEYLKISQDEEKAKKYNIRSGVGLAAPQIGIQKRMLAIYVQYEDKVYEYALVNPKIINPNDFLEEVIEERLPNKAIPDTPWRIATDTSQKVSVRYGETIKAYIKNGYDLNSLKYIPLAIAGWLRYLVGVNDKLQPMELSADPMLKQLKEELKDVKISKNYNHELINILKNAQIFGLDLTLTPLKDKIEMYFESLIAGEDAVIDTLKKYIG